jgi:hypothetical protein
VLAQYSNTPALHSAGFEDDGDENEAPGEHIQHRYAEYNSEEEHGVGRTATADLSFPAFSLVSARSRSFMFQVSYARPGTQSRKV